METKINRKVKCLENLISNIGLKKFPLLKIILFGSFVSGDFHERSDLDLCFVFDEDKEPTIREKIEIESYFDAAVGAEMDVDFLYATNERVIEGDRVFKNIREKGVVLWKHTGE